MNKIHFFSGYTGTPKCVVTIEDKEYVLEIKEIENLLLNLIKEKGYTTSKTKQQKYYRLNINI